MRKYFAVAVAALAALFAVPAMSADIPSYPPIIEIPPPVDYGYQGSFYLRGSGALNLHQAWNVLAYDCTPCGGATTITYNTDRVGFGYSVGAGLGFETGTGLRFDATIDYLSADGASITKPASANFPGAYSLRLRSTIALANVYYDFALGGGGYGGGGHGGHAGGYGGGGGGYSAGGGMFGYVGAGAGVAFNRVEVSSPANNPIPGGTNTSFAAAGMAGVGYDFGAFTTDVGYRALYIADIGNNAGPPGGFSIPGNLVHEVRGTLRYRFH
jgi:hypothetical protein